MKKVIRIPQERIRISIPKSSAWWRYSNPSKEDSNPDSKECKLKNLKVVIQITMEVIRIPITISLHENQDSNRCSMDSNLDFEKGLNGCSMKVIRIPIQWIRIQISVRGTLMNWFESLVKKKIKLKATDSNHTDNDSNPSWRTSKEIEARIWITYTVIRIPESEVMKNKARRFESSSYGFESLHKLKLKAEGQTKRFESLIGVKFKYCKGNSNHSNIDLNLSFCRSIYCSTCNCNNSTFNSNLSHNG